MPELPYVLTYGERRPIEAGMQVEADIALDRRRLYQWLFDPLASLGSLAALGRPSPSATHAPPASSAPPDKVGTVASPNPR